MKRVGSGHRRTGTCAAVARILLTALLATAMLAAGAPAADATDPSRRPPLFGTKEIRSSKLDKFKKWKGVLERYAKERPKELAKCRLTPTNPCYIAKWRIFLKKIANLPRRKQLEQVNAYINRWIYKLDPEVYRKKDYWATPAQFFYRSGDCEDYAIAKYVSLLHLGFPKEDMRIVVLQDLNLKIPHAILVVYFEGEALVLDNQIKQVVNANRIRHYRPIYSINEQHWWLHRS